MILAKEKIKEKEEKKYDDYVNYRKQRAKE